MISVLIPISTIHISQYNRIEIQISREPLGMLFFDTIDSRHLKSRTANYIQEIILNNAKKFSQSREKLSFKEVDSFEYYVYQLISMSFPCIWLGLFEGDWRVIFKDKGILHTVDFILNVPKSVLLIECTRQYTAHRSVVGNVEVKKLLHVKEKLELQGIRVYAVLICEEYYNGNSQFFNSEMEKYPNVYFIFKEGMEMIESQIHLMTEYTRYGETPRWVATRIIWNVPVILSSTCWSNEGISGKNYFKYSRRIAAQCRQIICQSYGKSKMINGIDR
jgi:hypothetical protein